METLRLSDLSIGYRQGRKTINTVASGISATIDSAQLTCLLGSNGVGKSTLLRTIAGFQPQLSGSIFIEGNDINTMSAKAMSRKISVVLTEKPDANNITVAELVGLGRSPYTGFWGSLTENDKEIVKSSLQMVGIENLANRYIQTLSDGEKQKTMIAKALAQQTPIIILDEPTAFLDFQSKVSTMRLLCRLAHDMGKTIFLSTHDVTIAMQTADNIWLMEDNLPIRSGSPAELASDGTFASFVGHDNISFDPNTFAIRIAQ